MCGICGYIGSFDKDLLNRMSHLISHRGPDDTGEWYSEDNSVGLGHTRLSILDLSIAGHQPMETDDGCFVICYNGEIYNFEELRKDLESKGECFKSNCDTEVILKGYRAEGIDYVKKLNGIFAFAIYNKVDKTVFVVRDGMGVKPLYLGKTSTGYLFSSELKSLLKEKSLSREIDERGLMNYLSFIWSPSETTLLKSIQKVLPGEALLFQDGKLQKKWFFYDIQYSSSISKISESEAIEKLDFLLDQAVKRQLLSDVPVGAFLSGGLDSSSLCYYANKYTENKFECFTIDLSPDDLKKEGIINDLPYAKKVADYLGVNLNIIPVESSSVISNLDKMIYHLDEPQADPAILNTMFIAQLAREHGIKVLLSGAGGDDLFTGYRRHYAFLQEKYWRYWPQQVRGLLKMLSGELPINQHLLRRIKKAFMYADLSDEERLASYFLWCQPSMVCSLLDKQISSEFQTSTILSPLVSTLKRLPIGTPPLNKMLYLEGKHFLADHNLNYTDKMTMAYGVEARVPFLDTDLIDFACKLPLEFKQKGKIGKYLLKKTMERYLPHDIIYRPKTGFGAPIKKWLKHELKEVVNDTLSESNIRRRGLFNYQEVHKMIELDRQERIDASYTIFGLLCIDMWITTFID